MKHRIALTLRHNIEIESDVALALREVQALTGSKDDLRPLRTWAECRETPFGRLPRQLQEQLRARLRRGSPVGFACEVTNEGVERLLRHAAFVQDVAGMDTEASAPKSPLIEQHAGGVYTGVPASTLAEYASEFLDAPHSDAQLRLDGLLRFVLTGDDRFKSPDAVRAIRSKKSTLALTHDLHIYKAKFFPRMVHALLNVFSTDLAGGTLLDPFCGSGTALLEASVGSLQSIGTDLDPLSALISRCKVEPFTRGRAHTRSVLQAIDKGLGDGPLFRSRTRQTQSWLPEELRAKLARRDTRDGTAFLPEIEADLGILAALRERFREKEPGILEVLLSDAVTKKIRYRFVGVGNGKYTIEVVRQPILDRFSSKVRSSLALCDVFEWLETRVGVSLAPSSASIGDATCLQGVPKKVVIGGCITSPPYLPASSGREHYASSRALALSVTGLSDAMKHNKFVGAAECDDERKFNPKSLTRAGEDLLRYLMSDESLDADPQRDAMRFARKAVPTWRYLLDIERFLDSLHKRINDGGLCLMVVASQHTFYSHRRLQEAKRNGDGEQAIEYVARGCELYGEIAERAGWVLDEEIKMQLAKSATSMARPRSQDDYSESILVLRPKRAG